MGRDHSVLFQEDPNHRFQWTLQSLRSLRVVECQLWVGSRPSNQGGSFGKGPSAILRAPAELAMISSLRWLPKMKGLPIEVDQCGDALRLRRFSNNLRQRLDAVPAMEIPDYVAKLAHGLAKNVTRDRSGRAELARILSVQVVHFYVELSGRSELVDICESCWGFWELRPLPTSVIS